MLNSPLTDLGGAVKAMPASASQTAGGVPIMTTAGATEDGVEVEGKSIDRLNYDSAVLVIPWMVALTADKTFSLTVNEQQSSDDSNWDSATVVQAITVQATGAETGLEGVEELEINLRPKKRYVRYNITPTLSHTSLDDAIWSATLVMGGAVNLPAA